MPSALGRLARLAPPPRSRGRADLSTDLLGARLPPDYLELVAAYGAGRFGGFIDALDLTDGGDGFPRLRALLFSLRLSQHNLPVPGVSGLREVNSVPLLDARPAKGKR